MATEDLLDHFKLEAEVFPNYTVHSSTRYDRRRGVREKVEVRWDRLKRVGDGVFGQVWLDEHAHSTDIRDTRAVKIIDKYKMKSSQIDYKKELLALAKFCKEEYRQAEVLVAFLGWFETEQDIYLAMEYFEHGDLARHIPNISTEDKVRQITVDLLEGLKIIHAEGFAHRDLKPQNIFVVEMPPNARRWWVKIGDFGISKRVKDDSTALRTQAGTPLFWAPEICGFVNEDDETSTYSKAVDLWSLGCIVYNISAGKVPFARRYDINIFCRKRTPLAEEPLHRLMSPEGIWFVKHLLVPESTGRMSIDRALQDVWVRKLSESTTSAPLDTMSVGKTNTLNLMVPLVKASETMTNDLSGSTYPAVERTTEDTTSMKNRSSRTQDPTILLANHTASNITPTADGFYNGTLNTVTRKVSDLLNFSKGAASLLPAPGQASMHTKSASPTLSIQAGVGTGHLLQIYRERPSSTDCNWRLSEPEISRWTERCGTLTINEDKKHLLCADRDWADRTWNIAGYDLTTRKLITVHELKVETYHKDVECVALSPKDTLLAIGTKSIVTLYNFRHGRLERHLCRNTGSTEAIAFSSKGTWIVTSSYDDDICVWNGSNGQFQHTLPTCPSVVVALAFSSDERLLVCGSRNSKVSVWHTRSRDPIEIWNGHAASISSVAISPNGLFVASASREYSVLLRGRGSESHRQVITLEAPPYSLGLSLAFSPDSALIACSSRQGAILLFSVETGELQTILTSEGSQNGIRSLMFSQEFGTLIAAQKDGKVKIWDAVQPETSK